MKIMSIKPYDDYNNTPPGATELSERSQHRLAIQHRVMGGKY